MKKAGLGTVGRVFLRECFLLITAKRGKSMTVNLSCFVAILMSNQKIITSWDHNSKDMLPLKIGRNLKGLKLQWMTLKRPPFFAQKMQISFKLSPLIPL